MKFRVARHTNDFEPIINFYVNILGLELLGEFENHADYDGIFIGDKNVGWHLEFTKSKDKANRIVDEDDLLVFYAESKLVYHNILNRFKENNIETVVAKNPYWNKNGVVFLDPDKHGVVITYNKLT